MKNSYATLRLTAFGAVLAFVLIMTLRQGRGQTHATSHPGVTVHEWGTFTSLQGADGVPIFWKPQSSAPLPSFVHAVSRVGKSSLYSLQRMETPVIYFYSSQPQTVDLTVRLPKGQFTECYPSAGGFSNLVGLHWANFEIAPSESNIEFPSDGAGSNYFAARETDSDAVRVHGEREKFLFYRGVTDFITPLRVSMTSPDTVTISNAGPQELEDLFVLGIERAHGKFVQVDRLKPGEQKTVGLSSPAAGKSLKALDQDLSRNMAQALVRQRLFPKEAWAMVRTWNNSWFQDDGWRVLYVLPRAWTDASLPLVMTPAPSELTRVMVGRAELLSPTTVSDLAATLIKVQAGDPSAQAHIQEIKQRLGRFAEAAMNQAARQIPGNAREKQQLIARELVAGAN